MACRRRRQRSHPDDGDRPVPSNMDHLAFKYMEMCKVDTDSDSDSEISPRWSDTSTMGCVSSAPQSGTIRRTLPLKPATRHGCYSLFLDPYDGSSEESDTDTGISRRAKQHGKGSAGCRCRKYILHHPAPVALREVMKTGMRHPVPEHLLDVQMKCGSDSEVWVCELEHSPSHIDKDGCRDLHVVVANDSTTRTQTMDVESQLDDSGLQATISATPHTFGPLTSVGGNSSEMQDSSSDRSPSLRNFASVYKRKLDIPGHVMELGPRKRQCVDNMEDEHAAVDSASEPCFRP